MESTGVYWIPVFDILEQLGFTVVLHLVGALQLPRFRATRSALTDHRLEGSTLTVVLMAAPASTIMNKIHWPAASGRSAPRPLIAAMNKSLPNPLMSNPPS
jgi:hypothetical protein